MVGRVNGETDLWVTLPILADSMETEVKFKPSVKDRAKSHFYVGEDAFQELRPESQEPGWRLFFFLTSTTGMLFFLQRGTNLLDKRW